MIIINNIRQILQAEFVLSIGLIITSILILTNSLFDRKRNRLFFIAVVLNTVMLLIVGVDFMLSNINTGEFYFLRRITSFLNFACGPLLPLLLWRIFNEKKLSLLAYIPAIINFILCFISIMYPIVFFIHIDNSYQRGPLFAVSVIVSIFYVVLLMFHPVNDRIYRKHMERIFLLSITFLLLICVLLEVVVGLHFMNWSCSAMALILYYLVLNIQTNITDSLTGLYNRSMYEKAMEDINGKKNCILSMLDINNFKHINDTYGHDLGDRCLVTFARVFQEQLHPSTKMYRIGGDEFVIISKKQSFKEVTAELDRIRILLNEKSLDFAYGTCSYSVQENLRSVLKSADEQMYMDKKNRKIFNNFSDISLDIIQ